MQDTRILIFLLLNKEIIKICKDFFFTNTHFYFSFPQISFQICFFSLQFILLRRKTKRRVKHLSYPILSVLSFELVIGIARRPSETTSLDNISNLK